jgi:hypothetical protein
MNAKSTITASAPPPGAQARASGGLVYEQTLPASPREALASRGEAVFRVKAIAIGRSPEATGPAKQTTMKTNVPIKPQPIPARPQTPDIQRRINAGWLRLLREILGRRRRACHSSDRVCPSIQGEMNAKSKVQTPGRGDRARHSTLNPPCSSQGNEALISIAPWLHHSSLFVPRHSTLAPLSPFRRVNLGPRCGPRAPVQQQTTESRAGVPPAPLNNKTKKGK